MKTMLLISAKACWGKTTLVKTLFSLIPMENVTLFNYDGNILNNCEGNYILCTGEYKREGTSKTIGLSSEGDTADIVKAGIEILTQNFNTNIDVLIQACRTRGGTINTAIALAKQHGYETIVLSSYHGVELNSSDNYYNMSGRESLPNGLDLNQACARSIEELIKSL